MSAQARMQDDILSYREMCDAEGIQTLQRGMNFRLKPTHSVILMSQRSNAPYRDKVYEDGLPSNMRVMMSLNVHSSTIQKLKINGIGRQLVSLLEMGYLYAPSLNTRTEAQPQS
jgi:hypothetical protein